MSNAFSIPIPKAQYETERDPFPPPTCVFCAKVVRVDSEARNTVVLRQLHHDGFDGTLEHFYVPRTRPGEGVVYAHRVCGFPERP